MSASRKYADTENSLNQIPLVPSKTTNSVVHVAIGNADPGILRCLTLAPFLVAVCTSESMSKTSHATPDTSRAKNVPSVTFAIVSGESSTEAQVMTKRTGDAWFPTFAHSIGSTYESNAVPSSASSSKPPKAPSFPEEVFSEFP